MSDITTGNICYYHKLLIFEEKKLLDISTMTLPRREKSTDLEQFKVQSSKLVQGNLPPRPFGRHGPSQ